MFASTTQTMIYSMMLIFSFCSSFSSVYGRLPTQMKMVVSSDTLHPRHFKPGVGVENLPDAIYYNKFIPLIFQLTVPDWNADALRLNSSGQCKTDETKQSNGYCPVGFHFDKILGPMSENMRFSKGIYSPRPGDVYFNQFSCNIIEPHFHHISIPKSDLSLYLEKLKKDCPLAKNVPLVSKNLSDAAAKHIIIASNKFNSFFDKTTNLSNEANIARMAGYMALQDAYILTKYMDTIRWNNAYQSCQSSKLNIGLVSSFLLEDSLQKVQKIAEEEGYTLSIPFNEYLPQYYKLPLADCIISVESPSKTTLVIRLLVPVKKSFTKYSRLRLNKIPYLITEGYQKRVCEMDSFDSVEQFIVETSSRSTAEPIVTLAADCYENDLCYMPEQARRVVVDPCVKGLLNGSLDDIRNYCSFECFDIDHEVAVFPIIMKIASNQFTITGTSSSKIDLKCESSSENQELLPSKTNGVLQVILPCDCEIRYRTQAFRSTFPCDAPLEIHYLVSQPLELTTLQEAQNLWSMFNRTYNGTHLTNSGGMGHHTVPAAGLSDPGTHHGPHGKEKCNDHTGQLIIIWMIIVFLGLSNAFLIYVSFANGFISVKALTGICSQLASRGGSSAPSVPRSRLQNEATQDHDHWPATLNQL